MSAKQVSTPVPARDLIDRSVQVAGLFQAQWDMTSHYQLDIVAAESEVFVAFAGWRRLVDFVVGRIGVGFEGLEASKLDTGRGHTDKRGSRWRRTSEDVEASSGHPGDGVRRTSGRLGQQLEVRSEGNDPSAGWRV